MKPSKRKPEFLTTLRYDDLSTFQKPIWIKVRESERVGFGFGFYSALLQHEVWIPIGFESDGRSSPRLLWGVVPPVGPALWAAVPHDFLYKEGGYFIGDLFIPVDQATADKVYRELMILKSFTKKQAWWSYTALSLFGKKAWNDHRRREAIMGE